MGIGRSPSHSDSAKSHIGYLVGLAGGGRPGSGGHGFARRIHQDSGTASTHGAISGGLLLAGLNAIGVGPTGQVRFCGCCGYGSRRTRILAGCCGNLGHVGARCILESDRHCVSLGGVSRLHFVVAASESGALGDKSRTVHCRGGGWAGPGAGDRSDHWGNHDRCFLVACFDLDSASNSWRTGSASDGTLGKLTAALAASAGQRFFIGRGGQGLGAWHAVPLRDKLRFHMFGRQLYRGCWSSQSPLLTKEGIKGRLPPGK